MLVLISVAVVTTAIVLPLGVYLGALRERARAELRRPAAPHEVLAKLRGPLAVAPRPVADRAGTEGAGMSSNYGYDANGWEREPFPARDEHEPERTSAHQKRLADHQRAMLEHPGCRECRIGWGVTQPGPGHCRDHDKHCSAAPCW